MSDLQDIIDQAFERRTQITPRNVETHIKEAVHEAIELLDSGCARDAAGEMDVFTDLGAGTYRRAVGNRRRGGGRRKLGYFHGRLYRPEYQNL